MVLKCLIAGCVFAWGLSLLLFIILIFKMTIIDDKKAQKKAISSSFNLSRNDLEFLIDLQHEMLTQDTVCQAAPRFWVVATDKHRIPGDIDSCDGSHLYCSDDCEIVCDGDIKSIIDYVIENHEEEVKDMTFSDKGHYWYIEYKENDEIEEEFIYSSEEILEFFKDREILSDVYELTYYREVHHNYPNTMFLTNRSCKEHIAANHYHYNDDAHSYAMTAWRSPEVEHLFKILDVIDWKTMRRDAYGTE